MRDPSVHAVYLFEWDHVVLRAGFEAPLAALAARTQAGFMGKTCVERTGTNWHHYTRFRRDPANRGRVNRTVFEPGTDRSLATFIWNEGNKTKKGRGVDQEDQTGGETSYFSEGKL